MRILFVSDVSIQAVIGGAERVLYEQAVGLQRRGHEVHILTRHLPEHRTDQETLEGVREWRYDINPSSGTSFLISTFRNGAFLFGRLQNEYAFDCINGHQPFSAWAVRRSSAAQGIPFVYTCHSLSFEEYISRRKKPSGFLGQGLDIFNAFLRRQIEKRAFAAADQIIALSEFTRNKLMAVYGIAENRILIIPGGVDIRRFHPMSGRKTVRNNLGLPVDRFILLTVRNLVPRMGLENLIEAMRAITRAIPDICLVIGGVGPLKASLIRQRDDLKLQDHIFFTGFIPEADLPDYYRSADVFVLPTVELEGFGLVTVEALASGTPVLGTPVGGTREILGRLDKNYLFRDSSPAALAELITETSRRFMENHERWEAASMQCRQFVEQHYTWEKNITDLEKVLEHVRHLRKT
ncbi:MAG: glycosyltransferase family 4 protein [Deltaproteobacteria bacterium]|nr:glycosyltransferase family 4 protein [Deltaproteobacteria bacterium]